MDSKRQYKHDMQEQEQLTPFDLKSLDVLQKLHLLQQIQEERDYDRWRDEIAELATDPNHEVREKALDVFWKLADPDFTNIAPEIINLDLDFPQALMGLASTDPHVPVRVEAARALGRYIYEGFRMESLPADVYEPVRDFLWNLYHSAGQPLDVLRAALEALGYITDEEVEDLVREAHSNPSREMRVSALFAMGRSEMDVIWDSIVLEELHNPDPEVRFEAVRAAGKTYASAAAGMLEELTEDPDRRIQIEAVRALGNTGRARSRELLLRLASSRDEDIRDAASTALEELSYFQGNATDDNWPDE